MTFWVIFLQFKTDKIIKPQKNVHILNKTRSINQNITKQTKKIHKTKIS